MGRRPLAYKLKETIGDIFERVKQKQKLEKETKEKLFSKQQDENTKEDELSPLTKEEKIQANLNALESLAVEITGEDLEFDKKKKKNKYKKWIMGDDDDINSIRVKQVKKKKLNYEKEFEPQLNMLRNLLAEQNKFRADLMKRFDLAAGPSNIRDAQMNKTIVDLATAISTAGNAALSTMKEIGTTKKTIAELIIKQRQLDSKFGGADSQDVGLMGSDIAAAILGKPTSSQQFLQPQQTQFPSTTQVQPPQDISVSRDFDPSTWNQDSFVSNHTKYEEIPHSFVVEWHPNEDKARFKAIDPDGNELKECPVPTFKIKNIDAERKIARDDFDQIYPLEIMV
jgi:hypothetical protein